MFRVFGWRKIAGLRLCLIALALVVLTLMIPSSVNASITPEYSLPITPIESDGQYARVPDWSQITFHTLPPILEDGEFVAPSDLNQTIGYDLSRRWRAGQTADTYLKLGDFQTTLYPQVFNLYTIAQLTNLNLEQVSLSALEMANWQTLDDLLIAIPGLGGRRVSDVPPISALLGQKFPGTPGFNPDAN